ncbi:CHAT domain-containing protein [Micromonospora soli]|uniref:CHAT domain-containing protein n=1 Tax=Micromonospora sp. NBRC 110009 TaxID=3061627 RepID=UPI002671300C|nr:CHAT domain-containing protein [Micromonospora sp. NBRC 110009]WKT96845.1 CHAT domain-containing protein [Micromonospora sp. NBRC 110009]
MALAREWDRLVAEVRELPDLADFLKPLDLETLLPPATEGPVVVVNVSQWRCDAIIVRHTGVTPRPLPDLTAQSAADWTNRYLNTLREAEQAADNLDAVREQRQGDTGMGRRQAVQRAERAMSAALQATEAMLNDLLAWLWDVAAEPVLDELGLHETPLPGAQWPRLWWCPTGPMTLLPLHAAGYHMSRDQPTRTVIDRVVSSYTPTLRALREARRPLDPTPRGHRMLAVGVGDAEGQRSLSGVTSELGTLAELVPADRLTMVVGPDATRDAIREQLVGHRWAHFSCHGTQDLRDPSRGGLMLSDGRLTVTDIATGQYHADFVGLSACKTATGGVDLLDEAISLSAALHYTGFRHVIGALWSVYDNDHTIQLFRTLYEEIITDGCLYPDRSARALHRATRALRDTARDQPSVWTPFTHTGP